MGVSMRRPSIEAGQLPVTCCPTPPPSLPTLYLQSSPPVTTMWLIGLQSTFCMEVRRESARKCVSVSVRKVNVVRHRPLHLEHDALVRLPGDLALAGLARADRDVRAKAEADLVAVPTPHYAVHRAVALRQRGAQHSITRPDLDLAVFPSRGKSGP